MGQLLHGSSVRGHAMALEALAFAALIVIVPNRRRPRRAVALLLLCLLLATAGLLAAGYNVYQDPWFGRYLE